MSNRIIFVQVFYVILEKEASLWNQIVVFFSSWYSINRMFPLAKHVNLIFKTIFFIFLFFFCISWFNSKLSIGII